jgi:outer membrane autotransporter protein
MPEFVQWAGNGIDAAGRAATAWARIQRDPAQVVISRDGVTLAAQTVRVVLGGDVWTGAAARRRGVLFGVTHHPTATDTDIQRGDVFAYAGSRYRVLHVARLPGAVQATVEAWQ